MGENAAADEYGIAVETRTPEDLAEARVDAWVERQLATAPPLTCEQRETLRRALGDRV